MKKRIIIVNNNVKIGGVQKALLSLLHEIAPKYDVTLYLLNRAGEYMDRIPDDITVIGGDSLYKYFGMSQAESKSNTKDFICRSALAVITKIFGRNIVLGIVSAFTTKLPDEYDCAISYLHDGRLHLLYGGCNDFVLSKITAKKKITFLHCDYEQCGSNHKSNNAMYDKFDYIAACSDGCRNAFLRVLPHLESRTKTVINCHNFQEILEMSRENPVTYNNEYVNIILVARLSTEKGIERAIVALKSVKDKGLKAKLHIVGDGGLKDPLNELCMELGISGDVTFYGGQSNPYRYMKNADFLLIPSFHEAAPLVIDEALCLGIPVLSTKTTSSEDMILQRRCGWVCDNTQEAINEELYNVVADRDGIIEMKHTLPSRTLCDNSEAVSMLNHIIN